MLTRETNNGLNGFVMVVHARVSRQRCASSAPGGERRRACLRARGAPSADRGRRHPGTEIDTTSAGRTWANNSRAFAPLDACSMSRRCGYGVTSSATDVSSSTTTMQAVPPMFNLAASLGHARGWLVMHAHFVR
jgi:hypothetical protein